MYFFLDGRRLGSDRPDAAGAVRRAGLSVPGDAGAGGHDITSSCATSGTPVLATSAFEVTAARVHRSALATSLPHIDQIDFGPGSLLVSALAALGMLLMIAFPAELFNTTWRSTTTRCGAGSVWRPDRSAAAATTACSSPPSSCSAGRSGSPCSRPAPSTRAPPSAPSA